MRILHAASAAFQEVRVFLPRLWTIVRQLWHEVMGFVFLAIAFFLIFGGQGLVKTLQTLDEDPDNFGRIVLVSLFVALFVWFGISSFWRARRISRGGSK